MSDREPKWMRLELAEAFEADARDLGVSRVARGRSGFFPQYKRAGGNPDRLDPWWRNRRNNFVKRHMAQVKARHEPLVDDDGLPTRRHLALIMWAYSPMSDERLRAMVKKLTPNRRRVLDEADVPVTVVDISPAQASFVEAEVIARFSDDGNDEVATLVHWLDLGLEKSGRKKLLVTDEALLSQLVLEAVNDIEDALANDDWASIDGMSSRRQTYDLQRSGQALWAKLDKGWAD